MDYRVISVDDHATEQPTTFTDRVPASLRDRVPRIEKDTDGISYWWIGDRRLTMAKHFIADDDERERRLETLTGMDSLSARIPAGDYDATARLKDYDLDGVDGAVMFPNFHRVWPFLKDDVEVRSLAVQAYNDWMADEWCGTDPTRLFGLAQLPLWDPDECAKEAVRAVEKGHRGVIFPQFPDVLGYPPMWDRQWDGLYATMEELDLPIALHVEMTPYATYGVRGGGSTDGPPLPPFAHTAANVSGVFGNQYPLVEWLLSGVFERFPRLKLFLAESGASWVPYALYQADHYFPVYSRFYATTLRMMPSEYARRQVYHGFFFDAISPTVLEVAGADNLMWEADYVHSVSTFPNSRRAQEVSLREITDPEQRQKILAGNAVKLFKLDQ